MSQAEVRAMKTIMASSSDNSALQEHHRSATI
ncbi:hypothetical protein E2C01_088383 [Portunus trituberculatus]|uniref:Uncharacterized protein n=1 Tax=Portunus trituberculatus TaxID=210409 RepID=A0A5B7JEB9_PORTR|nr:hypothetical protein [Portunus trituberculatus]